MSRFKNDIFKSLYGYVYIVSYYYEITKCFPNMLSYSHVNLFFFLESFYIVYITFTIVISLYTIFIFPLY